MDGRFDRPAPWRWLITYALFVLVPVVDLVVWSPPVARGAVVGVGFVFAAALAALCAGSRLAWCVLLVLDVAAVVFALLAFSLPAAFALLRLALLVLSPIREYVWRR